MASEKATWRADSLGPAKELEVGGGRIRYHEVGNGPPIVFAHGVLVNANLWRKVVPRLAADFRCIALDLPLGSHVTPAPGADLSPPGVADMVADAIERIGLEDVTLVGNDTAGAISQILVTRRPERIGRLVLTSCDAFDNFPPRLFKYVLLPPAMVPGLVPVLFGPLRLRAFRRLPIAFGWLAKRPIDRAAEDSYVLPPLTRGEIRKDVQRVLRQVDPRHTLEAAERLRDFDRPTLIAWSQEDKLFPPEHAERLAKILPRARLEWIEDSYTFSPEDQPERLAELIAGFVREPRAARAEVS
jgi:pimeloyl-ACP methyl ester carboxylesterase